MEKKKLIKVTALVAGVAVLITAIAVPIALTSKKSSVKKVFVNWIYDTTEIQNSLVPIVSIQDGPSFNAWLSDPANNATIMGWFQNTKYVKSIQVSATGQDVFTLTAEITFNPGFVNYRPIGTITLNNGKHIFNDLPEDKLYNTIVKKYVPYFTDSVDLKKKLNAALSSRETSREFINELATTDFYNNKIGIYIDSVGVKNVQNRNGSFYDITFIFTAKAGYTLHNNEVTVSIRKFNWNSKCNTLYGSIKYFV